MVPIFPCSVAALLEDVVADISLALCDNGEDSLIVSLGTDAERVVKETADDMCCDDPSESNFHIAYIFSSIVYKVIDALSNQFLGNERKVSCSRKQRLVPD